MKRVLIVLALLSIVVACGSAPSSPEFKSSVDTSGQENDARSRARIHTELAVGYYELRNMGVALEEVNEALRSDSTYGPAFNLAGLIYAELKEDRRAQENFQQALRIDPLDSDANNNYGRFLCDRKREGEAINMIPRGLAQSTVSAAGPFLLNAGVCSRRGGDMAAAEDYFEKALKVRANQPQALYQMATSPTRAANIPRLKVPDAPRPRFSGE